MSKQYINTYDIDGVILMDKKGVIGLTPLPSDHIITGRSWEEEEYTLKALQERGIRNKVWFNSLPFDKKTRESSGWHKAQVLKHLIQSYNVGCHFEDDPVQAEIISKHTFGQVNVVLLTHNLTEKENVWRG